MEAQHSGAAGFDGVEASIECSLDGGGAGTAKLGLRVSKEAVLFLVVGAAVILDKGDALGRLLDAAPALAGRVGNRLVAAA